MPRYFSLILAITLSGFSYAQNPQSWLPHPYVGIAGEMMGGGYWPFAAKGAVGFQVESRWFSFDAHAAYDNGHKTNDGDQPNPKGHDRYLGSSLYFRMPKGWFLGPGASWSQLSTTNYTKGSWRPTIGGGKDVFTMDCLNENCKGNFNFRLSVDYVPAWKDWQNGSQGPEFSIWFPSPAVRKHVYFHETIGIFRFHDTVTDRTNRQLTREQEGRHHFDSFGTFELVFRF